MQAYQHILLSVDFAGHDDQVAQRARDLANKYQARLSVLHVVENLPFADSIYGPMIPSDAELTSQLMDAAKERLAALADGISIPPENRWVEIGSPKLEIVRIAEENQVDLIVVGSHGRHGISLLLGSTASSVIHHARCDVLAVRIRSE